jgi:hypothetical protein
MSAIRIRPVVAVSVVAVLVTACTASSSPSAPASQAAPTDGGSAAETPFPAELNNDGPYRPTIDPARFTGTVDNPYFPLLPGARWVMEGSGESTGEVTTTVVTDETTTIMGVVCTVVRDEVKADGALQELTFDWYAQDADGNVWYFGEDTAEYENGEVSSRKGSWKAGVDGAQPGIIMPADPQPGMSYRQEYYAGEAEDEGGIIDLDAQAEVPFGHFAPALMTQDTNPLEPKVLEFKFYARDVGPVLAVSVSGGSDREELLSYRAGG